MVNRLQRFFRHVVSGRKWVCVVRRASADSNGSTAVEFAMLAMPFFALIFVIIESGYQLFVTSTLDHAVRVESRQLQIGAAQTAGMSAAQFKTRICSRLPSPSACDNLTVDVRVVDVWTNWLSITKRFGKNADRRLDSIGANPEFCLPIDNKIVIVRTFLKLPVLSGFWLVSDPEGAGSRGVSANHMFRVEPFGATTTSTTGCL
jgi:hypothetical protein